MKTSFRLWLMVLILYGGLMWMLWITRSPVPAQLSQTLRTLSSQGMPSPIPPPCVVNNGASNNNSPCAQAQNADIPTRIALTQVASAGEANGQTPEQTTGQTEEQAKPPKSKTKEAGNGEQNDGSDHIEPTALPKDGIPEADQGSGEQAEPTGATTVSDAILQTATRIPAFPGAEGYGAQSIGGRGGRVIAVTNLNDSGPGSLRAAVEASGPRTVVFRVAGLITLKNELRVRNPYLTVAGQTAPGGGIMVRAINGAVMRIERDAHDIIIRYLRFRRGRDLAGEQENNDNISINAGYNIMIDHMSLSWSTDENIEIWKTKPEGPLHNISVQNSIMAEGIIDHSNGMMVGGEADYSDPNNPLELWKLVKDISVHHNLFIHNTHRNPRVTSNGTEVINNVIYNWKYRVGSTTRGSVIDIINNYALAGPMTSNPDRIYMHESYPEGHPEQKYPDPSIYINGNIARPQHPDAAEDGWNFIKHNWTYERLSDSFRRLERLPVAYFPVTLQTAEEAFGWVLANGGANVRLDCEGNWQANSDAVDLRLLNDVRNQTGENIPPTRPRDVGGYPDLALAAPCDDRDGDGMPDAWETRYGFNPDDPTDGAMDANGDGYTNLEHYLNGTDPRK